MKGGGIRISYAGTDFLQTKPGSPQKSFRLAQTKLSQESPNGRAALFSKALPKMALGQSRVACEFARAHTARKLFACQSFQTTEPGAFRRCDEMIVPDLREKSGEIGLGPRLPAIFLKI